MTKNKISSVLNLFFLLFINISIIKSQNPKNNQTQEDINREEARNIIKTFSYEWENKMNDYKMEYLYYIPINRRDQEIYFENVTTVPTIFKGAFFLSDESTDKIEFYIRDSFDKIIYKSTGHYSIFEIQINKTGLYTITFRNNLARNKVVITFTMNTRQNNMINSTNLPNTEKNGYLEGVIKKFNMEFKLSRDIHIRRYQSKL